MNRELSLSMVSGIIGDIFEKFSYESLYKFVKKSLEELRIESYWKFLKKILWNNVRIFGKIILDELAEILKEFSEKLWSNS